MPSFPASRRVGAAAFLALSFLGAAAARSDPFDGNPKLFLHATPVTTNEVCTAGGLVDCNAAVTHVNLNEPSFVYLLVARGDLPNLAGLECGLNYESGASNGRTNHQGLDILSWTLCATLQFSSPLPAWPSPGSGNLITWNTTTSCQTGAVAVAGYFYVAAYGADVLSVTARPASGKAAVATCAAVIRNLEPGDLGSVRFSDQTSEVGCNPCNEPCGSLSQPTCHLSPLAMDFGSVTVGRTLALDLTLTNQSDGTLSGTLTENGVNFEIVGSPDYSLDAGASAVFGVAFHATQTGTETCTITAGNGCAAVPVVARATPAIGCEMTPSLIDFGYVPLGASADRTFTIRNSGPEAFNVNYQVCYTWWPDPQFGIVGPKSFALEPGQEVTSTVRFTPNERNRDAACQISAGLAGCAMIDLLGTTIPDEGCAVVPEKIDFGSGSGYQSLTLRNLGGPPISGTLQFTSNPENQFAISGNPAYTLSAGQSTTWLVSFHPVRQGPVEGSLSTGCGIEIPLFGFRSTAMAQVLVYGGGGFPYVAVGDSAFTTFILLYYGTGRLVGRAGEGCPDFFIAGSDSVNIGQNESDTLTVGFAPSHRYQQSCRIYLPGVEPITLTGNTVALPPLAVQPDFLNFGSVSPGDSVVLNFAITNATSAPIGGPLVEDCSDFLTDQSQVALAVGETKTINVTFKPAAAGQQVCDVRFLDRTLVRCVANQSVPVRPVTWSEIKTRY
jgi:hypothetical protein